MAEANRTAITKSMQTASNLNTNVEEKKQILNSSVKDTALAVTVYNQKDVSGLTHAAAPVEHQFLDKHVTSGNPTHDRPENLRHVPANSTTHDISGNPTHDRPGNLRHVPANSKTNDTSGNPINDRPGNLRHVPANSKTHDPSENTTHVRPGNLRHVPPNSTTHDPSGNTTRDPSKKTTHDTSKNTTRDPSKNRTRDPSKNETRDPSKKTTRGSSKNLTHDTSKNTTRGSSKNTTHDPSGDTTRDPSGNTTHNTSGNTIHTFPGNAAHDPSGNKTHDPVKNPALHLSDNLTYNPIEIQANDPLKNPILEPSGNPTHNPVEYPRQDPLDVQTYDQVATQVCHPIQCKLDTHTHDEGCTGCHSTKVQPNQQSTHSSELSSLTPGVRLAFKSHLTNVSCPENQISYPMESFQHVRSANQTSFNDNALYPLAQNERYDDMGEMHAYNTVLEDQIFPNRNRTNLPLATVSNSITFSSDSYVPAAMSSHVVVPPPTSSHLYRQIMSSPLVYGPATSSSLVFESTLSSSHMYRPLTSLNDYRHQEESRHHHQPMWNGSMTASASVPIINEIVSNEIPVTSASVPVIKEIVSNEIPVTSASVPVINEIVSNEIPVTSASVPVINEIVFNEIPVTSASVPVINEIVFSEIPVTSASVPVISEIIFNEIPVTGELRTQHGRNADQIRTVTWEYTNQTSTLLSRREIGYDYANTAMDNVLSTFQERVPLNSNSTQLRNQGPRPNSMHYSTNRDNPVLDLTSHVISLNNLQDQDINYRDSRLHGEGLQEGGFEMDLHADPIDRGTRLQRLNINQRNNGFIIARATNGNPLGYPCPVCENCANITILDCGHCVVCSSCVRRIRRCPICWHLIRSFRYNCR